MTKDLTQGSPVRLILGFALPLLAGMLFQQLYNLVDTLIVGRFLGMEALAGVGATGSINFLVLGFCMGVCSGFAIPVAQQFGAREESRMREFVANGTWLSIVFALVMTVLTVVYCGDILRVMNTPTDCFEQAYDYIVVIFAGIPFTFLYNLLSGWLRSLGDSKTPLFFLVLSSVLNVILDLAFILIFKLGVFGASLATVLSQVVSAVLVMMTLCRSPQVYRVQLKKIRFYGDMLVRIVRIGLPAGLQSVMYSLSNIIIQASVNGFGTDVMAAYTAYGKVDGMYWMVINAFGVAITTFVGQNFGARLYDRMKKSINVCLGIAAAVTLLLSGVLMVVAEPLLGLFSDDAQVLEIGLSIVRLIVPTYITYIFIEILSGAMRGAGDSLIPTIMTLTGVCLLRVFWVTVVVSAHHELNVLLLSYPITWIVTSSMFVVYYLRGRWLKRCIALQNAEN